MRTVLSAALTRAVREELIVRNVARLVELPEWQRRRASGPGPPMRPAFPGRSKPDPLYAGVRPARPLRPAPR